MSVAKEAFSPSPSKLGRVTDLESAVRLAREMSPNIKSKARDTERKRRISDEVIADMHQTGLFDVVKPKIFGGSEAGFESLVKATVEFSSVCGSTGWVYGVIAGHSWLLNLFPEQVQREVFATQDALLSTVFKFNANVVATEGGYHLTGGEGGFCSGVDFAKWVIIGGAVQNPGGPPEPRFFVVPMSDVEVVDDWHVLGMCGTGSRTIRIKDAFIPQHRSCSLDDMLAGTSPGAQFHREPLYRRSFASIAPFSIVGAPLGMAKGGLNCYLGQLGGRLKGMDPQLQAMQSGTLARYSGADAAVDAAIALVVNDARDLDKSYLIDQGPESPVESARISRNWSYAVQSARDALNSVYATAGASTLYSTSELQRFWRDVNSAAQHIAFAFDMAMPKHGRLAAGLENEDFLKKFIADNNKKH